LWWRQNPFLSRVACAFLCLTRKVNRAASSDRVVQSYRITTTTLLPRQPRPRRLPRAHLLPLVVHESLLGREHFPTFSTCRYGRTTTTTTSISTTTRTARTTRTTRTIRTIRTTRTAHTTRTARTACAAVPYNGYEQLGALL